MRSAHSLVVEELGGILAGDIHFAVLHAHETVELAVVAEILHLGFILADGDLLAEPQVVVVVTLGDEEMVMLARRNGVTPIGIDQGDGGVGLVETIGLVLVLQEKAVGSVGGEPSGGKGGHIGQISLEVGAFLQGGEQVVSAALLALEHHIRGILGGVDHHKLVVAADARTRLVIVLRDGHILR